MRINGSDAAGIYLDGMCDEMRIIKAVTGPLTSPENFTDGVKTSEQICLTVYKGVDLKRSARPAQTAESLTLGLFALLLEGENEAFIFGAQGFPKMNVGEAQSEQNEFGGREGFTDSIKDNVALLRRKLHTPKLVTEHLSIGKTTSLPVAICYLSDRTDREILKKIRSKLKGMDCDTVFGSGWLRPALNGKAPSLFPATGMTERPDVLAYKLCEGRIGVLAEGSPFAVIAPYLFTDYFQSPDDYLAGAAFSVFIRSLRLICFFAAVALPGLFVAVCDFHPNMLPPEIMFKIASAEAQTPLPLVLEAVVIHLIYEAVREAGLRMPKAAGHTVSIVGALVIGDAAVTAGLIAAPMLIVVALTTVCSAVISKLQDRTAVLRMVFIALGGLAGFFGIFTGLGFIITEICSVSPYAVPLSAPVSPFEKTAFGDSVFMAGIKKLSGRKTNMRELKF